MESLRPALRDAARQLARNIKDGAVIGLGSGSTMAILLQELSPALKKRDVSVWGVVTSAQIEAVAEEYGFKLATFRGRVDLCIDGADQVDRDLNLIKGGGGALLKEKIVMSSAKKVAIVAAEAKFSGALCEGGTRVPVEVFPLAKETVTRELKRLGGGPVERLLPKGYPYFTEGGNIILDTAFEPLADAARLELDVKSLPGVAEVGIFTIKPITVFKLMEDGKADPISK